MTIQILPSGGACGATITGLDLSQALRPSELNVIRTTFLAHQVLAFPGQTMTDDDLERFTLAFGSFGEDPFIAPIPGRAHVLEVRREADEKTPLFAEAWHSDWSFLETPPAATILYGVEIPPMGGDTLFSNQYAAYDALDDATKQKLDGVMGVHSARRGYARNGVYGDGDKGRSMTIRPSDAALKTRLHPIVRTHPETGRKALFVNMGYTIGVEGMNDDEASALLWPLFQHSMRDEFVFAQRWSEGQLVMWDNRCVNHRATGGYEGHRRVLHRTTVAG